MHNKTIALNKFTCKCIILLLSWFAALFCACADVNRCLKTSWHVFIVWPAGARGKWDVYGENAYLRRRIRATDWSYGMFTKSLTLFSVFIVELVSYRRKQLISERSAWSHVSPLSAMSFFLIFCTMIQNIVGPI